MRVAMTVDTEHPDRPAAPGNPDRLLDLLAGRDVRGTFFVQGRWAEANPECAHRIAAHGHLIGNHGKSHAPMTMLTDQGIRESLSDAEASIRRIAGADPRPWFRCPYGEGEDDARVLGVIAELGYRNIGWDVDTRDWAAERTPPELAGVIVDGCIAHGDGARVLVHSWPDVTVAALPEAVDRLRALGAAFVGVDEL
jgi:peptidoglycan-N-acetylglucosamine deacetylase